MSRFIWVNHGDYLIVIQNIISRFFTIFRYFNGHIFKFFRINNIHGFTSSSTTSTGQEQGP